MEEFAPEVSAALRSLVDDYKARCLWFLERDYYPASVEEALLVLDAIQRHGDVAAFRRTAEVREWFSPSTIANSVGY